MRQRLARFATKGAPVMLPKEVQYKLDMIELERNTCFTFQF